MLSFLIRLFSVPVSVLLNVVGYLSFPTFGQTRGQAVGTSDTSPLELLRSQQKYVASEMYTGPGSAEEGQELIERVNTAIDDILALSRPFQRKAVLQRLRGLARSLYLFETEDRDKTHTYIVLIWRAAGFQDNSGLFSVSDDRVLKLDLDYQLTQ